MKVDTKAIEWLLANATRYRISKETGVPQSNLSDLVNGKREMKNLTIEVGSKLTACAKKLKKELKKVEV